MAILNPVIVNHFRPEFINRLDEILPFLPLKEIDMEKIAALQLQLLKKRMQDRDIELSWSPEALTHLAKEGYDARYGARPLKRYIQEVVVNQLSQAILENKIFPNSIVKLDLENDKIIYSVEEMILVNI